MLDSTRDRLKSLTQQTGLVFLCLLAVLALTAGSPPPTTLGFIFCSGIILIAWLEKRNASAIQDNSTATRARQVVNDTVVSNTIKKEEKYNSSTLQRVLVKPKRMAIFINGANLFYACLQLGIEIDYTKLLNTLKGDYPLFRAFFYTGVDRQNEKQQGFLLWMRRNGYRVVTKDIVMLRDGSRRANVDVEMAVDMMDLSEFYDTAVLVSGDNELAYAVDAVSQLGIRVRVVSLRAMTSDFLINVSDEYIDLQNLEKDIKKTSRDTYGRDYLVKPPTSIPEYASAEKHNRKNASSTDKA